jgi:hypothetical protein
VGRQPNGRRPIGINTWLAFRSRAVEDQINRLLGAAECRAIQRTAGAIRVPAVGIKRHRTGLSDRTMLAATDIETLCRIVATGTHKSMLHFGDIPGI